jgi:hypothetical protein
MIVAAKIQLKQYDYIIIVFFYFRRKFHSMKIEDLFIGSTDDIVERLRTKSVKVPLWNNLKKEYYPYLHPVMDRSKYPDVINEKGGVEDVTRITLDWQRLAVKRTTELCFGIPVKRVYKPKTNGEREVSKAIEAILQRNRIDSLNIERGNMLFSSCEFATLWYPIKEKNNLYGFDSELKLRCRNYSPLNNSQIYPFFDEIDDLIALSFGYTKKIGDDDVEYLDTYTEELHIKYCLNDGKWKEEIKEKHSLGKIPAVYCYRPSPAWEDTSNLVYETEWTLSRNGNYIRKNSKPIIALFADKQVPVGKEGSENEEFKGVFQYPAGSELKYVTWQQAIDSIKFQTETLRKEFFSQLQLPDMGFENLKSTPMSGEARKMMFIDSQLKVKDESGRLLETFDREINVIKQFLKLMMPTRLKEIDALVVETQITPYNLTDDKDTIDNLMSLTAGKAIVPVAEAVERLGWSSDVSKTIELLDKEKTGDVFE